MTTNTLTESQKIALELLNGTQNVFLTGKAGSGKSYVVRHFMINKNPKKFPVLASTGAAAVLIGGRTFHSFMGLGIMDGGVVATVERALGDKRTLSRIKKIEGFILDEVSMISEEALEAAECICRLGRESDLPWGGIRVVAVGDFAQLPPVQRSSQKKWAFLGPVWEETKFASILLKENHRTSNSEFLSILNSVREGNVTDKVANYLNSKLVESFDDFEGTFLFPRRAQTNSYNQNELNKIDGEEYVFESKYTGKESYVRSLKKNSPLEEVIRIKVGCLVMLRQNDPKQRWVNGSTGWVDEVNDGYILISLLSGRKVKVEQVSFTLLNAEGLLLASVTNFPVSLAYAATIHKAQGMTLDRLMVDLTRLWEPGHAYVALSRVSDPDHLHIQGWQPNSIKCDPDVTAFYERIDREQVTRDTL